MKTYHRIAVLTLVLSSFVGQFSTASAQTSTIGEGDQYAWSGNSGWIDFNPHRPNAGDGIRVYDRFLSGYAWSPNTGWINFGDGTPANGISYANTSDTDYGVNQDGAGNLSGLAWSPNTGWINFGWASNTNTDRPRFDITTGVFTGYAWSANLGWINLNTGILKTDTVLITDTDGDGISDTWEIFYAGNLTTLNGTGDFDGDGIKDKDEYLLDTNPLVPNAPFKITRFVKTGPSFYEMEWPSSPARRYGFEAKQSLADTNWIFLGDVPGAANTNATVQPLNLGVPSVFLRLETKLPLRP